MENRTPQDALTRYVIAEVLKLTPEERIQLRDIIREYQKRKGSEGLSV